MREELPADGELDPLAGRGHDEDREPLEDDRDGQHGRPEADDADDVPPLLAEGQAVPLVVDAEREVHQVLDEQRARQLHRDVDDAEGDAEDVQAAERPQAAGHPADQLEVDLAVPLLVVRLVAGRGAVDRRSGE